MKNFNKILTGVVSSVLLFAATEASAIPVDIELNLAIDASGSISATDFTLQMQGYEAAFNNAVVQGNIASLTNGIAVGVTFFSNHAASSISALLQTAADASAFATQIGALARPFASTTNIAAGINLAQSWLTTNNYEGAVHIIDVSGDGAQNVSGSVTAARDAAAMAGTTINGLAIDDVPGFTGGCGALGYYTQNVITAGGACYQATGFADFERAVVAKIEKETRPPVVPEPATLALLGLGIAGLGLRKRKLA